MDSICSDGNCHLGSAIEDAVISAIGDNKELYDEAKDLLINQDSVMGAIKVKDKLAAMQDNISTLQKTLEEKEIIIGNKDIDIQEEMKEKKRLLTKNQKLLEEAKKAISEINKKEEEIKILKDNVSSLENTFTTYGVKEENGALTMDASALGNLLSISSSPIDKKISSDMVDSLRKAKKMDANTDANLDLGLRY